MRGKELNDKLISIYFKKTYTGAGEVTKEEQDFIDQDIVCIPTGKNGLDLDKEHINNHLEIGREYDLDYMNVGQSSSSVYIKGLTTGFNSVCFDFKLKQNE